jgi:hypothetical protein
MRASPPTRRSFGCRASSSYGSRRAGRRVEPGPDTPSSARPPPWIRSVPVSMRVPARALRHRAAAGPAARSLPPSGAGMTSTGSRPRWRTGTRTGRARSGSNGARSGIARATGPARSRSGTTSAGFPQQSPKPASSRATTASSALSRISPSTTRRCCTSLTSTRCAVVGRRWRRSPLLCATWPMPGHLRSPTISESRSSGSRPPRWLGRAMSRHTAAAAPQLIHPPVCGRGRGDRMGDLHGRVPSAREADRCRANASIAMRWLRSAVSRFRPRRSWVHWRAEDVGHHDALEPLGRRSIGSSVQSRAAERLLTCKVRSLSLRHDVLPASINGERLRSDNPSASGSR